MLYMEEGKILRNIQCKGQVSHVEVRALGQSDISQDGKICGHGKGQVEPSQTHPEDKYCIRLENIYYYIIFFTKIFITSYHRKIFVPKENEF